MRHRAGKTWLQRVEDRVDAMDGPDLVWVGLGAGILVVFGLVLALWSL